ncbi:MAG: RNA methyltransferase [Proteobacteria bacterium]|nr:RNA methyltransferase [Pseudomonadota bacterium]
MAADLPGNLKDNLNIVLVEPRGSGNVGSVARAMMNTGLRNLVLVNPCHHMNNEALSMACNATDVLAAAEIYETVTDAISETPVTFGATRRTGRLRYPMLTLKEASAEILKFSATNRVSILFGREDKGLMNEETAECDVLFEIPSDPEYASLNLAQAVMVVCHTLFMDSLEQSGPAVEPSITAAPRADIAAMYVHLEATLKELEYGEQGGEHILRAIMRSFHRLWGRTALMDKEVNMIRGILNQISARTVKK